MKGELKGQILLQTQTRAHAVKTVELQEMLGSASGQDTARAGCPKRPPS
jgi:hypothetical protein